VPAGLVGVPIRLAEPAALRLVHPGDRVDVFRVAGPGQAEVGGSGAGAVGTAAPGGSAAAIATAALVLGVTDAEDPITGALLVALTTAEARRILALPPGEYAVLIRRDG